MDSPSNSQPQPQQVNIIDVPVTDESVSLNLMVQFLNIAQKRGAFSIAESAKIFECIRLFINQSHQNQHSEPVQEDSTDDVGEEGEISLKE
jgi:hypothetical protein